ncbi:hypothetical protein [Streptomyces sp. CL12]|uniref:hypothetical protein n=1 Tax=Streptomyces sp. CL12 TaxID=3391744 RepID=UPI003A801E76
MRDFEAVADRAEIGALLGEFTDVAGLRPWFVFFSPLRHMRDVPRPEALVG